MMASFMSPGRRKEMGGVMSVRAAAGWARERGWIQRYSITMQHGRC